MRWRMRTFDAEQGHGVEDGHKACGCLAGEACAQCIGGHEAPRRAAIPFTFGRVQDAFEDPSCRLAILPPGGQDLAKQRYVEDLGASRCCCLGNGRTDRLMLKAASLGIAVMQGEGAAVESLMLATVAAPELQTALGLLLNPPCPVATLRI